MRFHHAAWRESNRWDYPYPAAGKPSVGGVGPALSDSLAAAWTCTKALCSGPPACRSGCASTRRNRTVVAGLGDEPKQSSKTLWRWRLRPAGGRGAEQAVFEVLEPESARHHRSGHERGQEQDGHDSHTRVRSCCRLIRQRLSEVPPACGSVLGRRTLLDMLIHEFDPGRE